MNAIRAFGPRAEAYAARLTTTAPTLVFEAAHASAAQRCAVDLKRKHGGFDLVTIFDEPRVTVAGFLAAHVATSFQTYDERRLALDTLARNELVVNGQPQRNYADVDVPILSTMRDVARLADRWLVRSWTEYHRLAARLEHEPMDVQRVLAPVRLPDFSRAAVDGSIVVWAPGASAAILFIITMALVEIRRPIHVITTLDDTSAQKLARAALVIAASSDDPGDALAFLARGIPVIAATTSGIAEYADISVYEPWSRRSVLDAVLCGLPAIPTVRTSLIPAMPVQPAARANTSDTPLVSLIVRTYNRERLLSRALGSIAAQTYRPVEAIVVNNGGRDVSDIVGEHEFCVPVVIENGSLTRAINAGLERARGVYVGLLDDDDALFPEHLELLVSALERSGAQAVYSDSLNVYLATSNNSLSVTGYAVVSASVNPSTMLSRCQLVGSSRMLTRRSVIDDAPFIENLTVAADYEMWLRINRKFDFARVNAVTTLYTQFADRSNASANAGHRYLDEHRAIYALHPVEARPKLLEDRKSILRFLEAQGGLGMTPPALPFSEPFPLD